jgi:hypothetical protein
VDVPTDLGQLCGTLAEFGLPRAIGHTSEGRLLLWNETFAQLAKLTEEQLRTAKISLSFDFARSSANQRRKNAWLR